MSDRRDPGDAWVTAADGGRYWGRFGAAGLLAYDRTRDAILLQHRVTWSDHGDTWGVPGGARHEGEPAIVGAIRESQEEAGVPDGVVAPRFTHVLDRGGWTYTTVVAEVVTAFEPNITDRESHALAWVKIADVERRPLHPAFATSWKLLRPLLAVSPAVIVDAANVIGAVPNGWWRDRRAAAGRLRDRVDAFVRSGEGVPSGFVGLSEAHVPGLDRAFPEWTLVVEGVARGIGAGASARVVDAPELGDDAIVAETATLATAGQAVTVVTNDLELRSHVTAAGAGALRGAKKLLKLLPSVDTKQ